MPDNRKEKIEIAIRKIIRKKYSDIKNWEIYFCPNKNTACEIILVANLECFVEAFKILPQTVLVDLSPFPTRFDKNLTQRVKDLPLHSIYGKNLNVYHYFNSTNNIPLLVRW